MADKNICTSRKTRMGNCGSPKKSKKTHEVCTCNYASTSTYVFKCVTKSEAEKRDTELVEETISCPSAIAQVDPDYVDVNKAAVLGTVSTGGGHSQLEEFLTFCDIPSMCFRKFLSCQNEIAPDIHAMVHDTILSAGKEKSELARKAGGVNIDGIPKITVIADGSWCKRSYKSNYNAASGVIHRDDSFWSEKMEKLLVEFYHKCVAPELLYPQHSKGLPIRDLRERKTRGKTTKRSSDKSNLFFYKL
ncbi:hypothetical protein RN001_013626 [Aquatica leii]|uniref:Mutator-like transposase domain-containing protein n=1 Tax=Aquatica leii TaxID=1421715 RepID=A0AAN7P4P8_9COLE|nr:hypothetical protein RN001_013626 [Aquatica leii]